MMENLRDYLTVAELDEERSRFTEATAEFSKLLESYGPPVTPIEVEMVQRFLDGSRSIEEYEQFSLVFARELQELIKRTECLRSRLLRDYTYELQAAREAQNEENILWATKGLLGLKSGLEPEQFNY